MKKILLTMLVGIFATGAVMAQDSKQAKAKSASSPEQLAKKKAEYDAMVKAKIEADKNHQSLPVAAPKKASLKNAAALTVENKNQ